MFNSRQRFGNDYIYIAIDTVSGELLELVNIKNGDNLIKSTPFNIPSMFSVALGSTRLSVPTLGMVRDFPELKPVITHSSDGKGTFINIIYNKLSDGKEIYDIQVELSITVPAESGRLLLSAEVKNNGGYDVDRFSFPVVNGIYLGENYKDDTLVYPFNAGMKFHNPVEYLSKKQKRIFWRWQEYRYNYPVDGAGAFKNTDELYSYSAPYTGPLSMAWMDLYDDDGGIYLGMHERNGICRLKAETFGPDFPGMTFAVEKTVESRESFFLNNIVLAVHEGDWHDGADIYREAHETATRAEPSWWDNSISLVAHYDFKYQNGGIVHRFSDIPALVEQAKSLNTDHMLFSGWHTDGFDNGFPEYFADSDLGSEQELAAGLKCAADNGIKVCFYINSRIANRKYAHLADFIKDNAVIKKDGTPEIEGYGDKALSFATMCAGSKGWQDRIVQAIEYVVGLGATGVYLDQLVMAAPRTCHNPLHNHAVDGWCDGYTKVLERANQIKTLDGNSISIITEGCGDIYGTLTNGSLVSTFFHLKIGAFPEIYRYTFPAHTLVDMVYPKKNLAMRPVHVAQQSSNLINKAFVTDMYFWIYDLETDNSFFGDPEQLAYLRKVLEIKREWKQKYKGFTFRDEKGISEKSPELMAKTFYKDDLCLIAYACDGKTLCELKTSFSADIVEFNCVEGADSVSEAIDPDRSYIRIAYSRCGTILLKKKQ